MTLPGDELVWVPTQAEVLNKQKDAAREAYQKFCWNGVRHEGIFQRPLTPRLMKIHNLLRVGWGVESIANRLGTTIANVNDAINKIKNNGWKI